ncbi:MAG: efflux RND transporter periplasmic adaptor subunit [Pseudomonadota bacterium]
MGLRRRVGIMGGLAICAALAGGAESAFAADERAITVVAFPSEARPFEDALTLRGRTEADRRVEVRSEISGLIASEPLRKGAVVEAGEILCRISDGDRRAELVEAEALLSEAQLNAEAADRLLERGFGAETTAKTRAAALEAARARVLRARIDIERLEIRAPFGGILETDTAELGSLLQNGSTCATLIALDPIKLVAFAPERSVDALKVGATVTGRLVTGREVTGEISFVARSADRDTRTYLIEADADNPDLTIRDGMTAELVVTLSGRPAHLLPQTALTLDDQGAVGVRLVEDGAARFAAVEILRDETRGVWVAGLPETADVIVVGQEFVTDGQAVKVEFIDEGRTQ